jgi:preprotein translocase subunit SecA
MAGLPSPDLLIPSFVGIGRLRATANRIVQKSEALASLTDEELRCRSDELRWQAQTGTPPRRLLVDAFALVREAARRTVRMQHFPVQVMGGIVLFRGDVAEMQTGEGKTLAAVMPAYLRGLVGRGCHIVTVNDYLARRDAETMGPIYRLLGSSVGCIQTEMSDDERREAYACDITYGTAKELGFDYLRDRLRQGENRKSRRRNPQADGAERPVQRDHYYALVDEADSIFIDEARTPLIIGLTRPNTASKTTLVRWCNRTAMKLEPNSDFVFEPEKRTVYLTDAGCRTVLLQPKPTLLDTVSVEEFYSNIEQALTARLIFSRDRDYVINDEEIVIVDESTGRMMEGRKWQEGLHQAVEAKELLPITPATAQAARITVQRFFRQYAHVSGTTGTAWLARGELRRAYRLKVAVIPTNRPCIRSGKPPRIFASLDAKQMAVVEQIVDICEQGRAVLVGTPSVTASESLGEKLKAVGMPHSILNARFHEQEAQIVAEAGKPQRVTIATNMAGRGTDIELAESVRQAGGLHVIATEMHSSPRIDRQLVGRAARQGDPGSYQFLLSLDDELLRSLPAGRRERLKADARPDARGELPRSWLSIFRSAQSKMARMHRKQRKQLLKREDQHTEMYRKMGLDPFTELAEEEG